MKFNINNKQTVSKVEPSNVTLEDIIAEYESWLHNDFQYCQLDTHCQDILTCIGNINLSLQMISIGGDDAVRILNVDKSIETLINDTSVKLNAIVACESLIDTAKRAIAKLCEMVSRLIEWIRQILFGNAAFIKKVGALAPKMDTVDTSKTVSVIPYDDVVNLLDNLEEITTQVRKVNDSIERGDDVKNADSPAIKSKDWVNPDDPKSADYKMRSLTETKEGTLKDLGWSSSNAKSMCAKFANLATSAEFNKFIKLGEKLYKEYLHSDEYANYVESEANKAKIPPALAVAVDRLQTWIALKGYVRAYYSTIRHIGFTLIKISKCQSGGLPDNGEYDKVHIDNLPYDASEQDVMDALSKYVTVFKVEIVRNQFNGNSKGFGYAYIAKGDGSKLEGKSINVKGRDIKISAGGNQSNSFFTEQELNDKTSCKTKLMRIISEVEKGKRSSEDATSAANELRRLKPDLFDEDDGSVSSDEKDINVVMGALVTNFSVEKIKLAIALASKK